MPVLAFDVGLERDCRAHASTIVCYEYGNPISNVRKHASAGFHDRWIFVVVEDANLMSNGGHPDRFLNTRNGAECCVGGIAILDDLLHNLAAHDGIGQLGRPID